MPEPNDSFRYDAFISYRHMRSDRSWAIWLHGALENYRLPPQLRKAQPQLPDRVKRVFRDEEELPASADLKKEIDEALVSSRFLIVVCSPATPESKWVNKEVERFRELGRDNCILSLLIEGEPHDAFPRALCEIRRKLTGAEGPEFKIELIEPLAADVRPRHGERLGTLKRMALLRILAAVLGCRFDDLRQRDQERQAGRLRAILAGLLALLLMLGGFTAYALNQRDIAKAAQLRAEENEKIAKSNELQAHKNRLESERITADALLDAGSVVEARHRLYENWHEKSQIGDSTFPCQISIWRELHGYGSPIMDTNIEDTTRRIRFSSDGQYLLCGGMDQKLNFFEVGTGTARTSLPGFSPFDVLYDSAKNTLHLADQQNYISAAFGGAEPRVQPWKTPAKDVIDTILTADAGYTVVARTGGVDLYNNSTGELSWTLPTTEITYIGPCADSRRFYTNTIRSMTVWNIGADGKVSKWAQRNVEFSPNTGAIVFVPKVAIAGTNQALSADQFFLQGLNDGRLLLQNAFKDQVMGELVASSSPIVRVNLALPPGANLDSAHILPHPKTE